MSQGKRVKELRSQLDLTLEKFGEKLGVGKTAISNIEKDKRNLTDQMALSICREYGVSEKWLRSGEGEMFVPVSRNEKIARFAGELMKDEAPEFRRQLVEVLAELDEDEWQVLANMAKRLAEKID